LPNEPGVPKLTTESFDFLDGLFIQNETENSVLEKSSASVTGSSNRRTGSGEVESPPPEVRSVEASIILTKP